MHQFSVTIIKLGDEKYEIHYLQDGVRVNQEIVEEWVVEAMQRAATWLDQ